MPSIIPTTVKPIRDKKIFDQLATPQCCKFCSPEGEQYFTESLVKCQTFYSSSINGSYFLIIPTERVTPYRLSHKVYI